MAALGLFAPDKRPLLHELISGQFNSTAVGYSVLLMTLLGLGSILLIELFIGVELLSTFLQSSSEAPDIDLRAGLLVFLSAVVFAYAAFGGLAAVVATDRWQLYLMLVASAFACGWLTWLLISGDSLLHRSVLLGEGVPISKGLLLPYPLLANMIVTNLLLIPALLRTWQLVAASEDSVAASRGVLKGIGWTAILSILLIAVAVLSYHGPLNGVLSNLPDFFTGIREKTGPLGRWVVHPLLFCAALAALLSTADSALLPVLQHVFGAIPRLRSSGPRQWWAVPLAALVVYAVVLASYFLVFRVFEFTFKNWLFTIFAFLIVTGPVIVLAIVAPASLLRDRRYSRAALIALWGGLTIAISLSAYGNAEGNSDLVLWNTPIAVAFEVLVLGGTTLLIKRRSA